MTMLNPFSPPQAEFSDPPTTWKTRVRQLLLWLLSIGAGAVLGYMLFNPLITLPAESVVATLKPVLRAARRIGTSSAFEYYFAMVSVIFFTNLPNTIVVSFAAAACLKFLQRRRQILYSSLLWPLFLFLVYWLKLGLLKLGAMRAGLPADRFSTLPEFEYTSILIFVTEVVFFATVLLLDRQFNKQKSSASANKQLA